MKFYFSLFCIFYIGNVFCQSFITLDKDTNEFVSDVNYSIFKNHKLIDHDVTLSDKATTIKITDFDSISFTKSEYIATGFKKENLDSIVYLQKASINLDEIVITNNREDLIIIGERNRLIKSQARPISRELLYGVVLRNETGINVKVNRVSIFLSKVKFKTRYKINFYKIQESLIVNGSQDIIREELIYSTDILTLTPGIKGKVDIDIESSYYFQSDDNLLVSVELIEYCDASGNAFLPKPDELTKLSFQLSDKADFYAKLANLYTHELSANLHNINLMTNYDFANRFLRKPHKSIIVTPAILLYCMK